MASSKQIKGWITANKKTLATTQSKIKKFEVALKKAEAAEKKKPVKKTKSNKRRGTRVEIEYEEEEDQPMQESAIAGSAW